MRVIDLMVQSMDNLGGEAESLSWYSGVGEFLI